MEHKNEADEIKKLVKDPRLVVGTRNTIKKLKDNKVEKIWFSSNVSDEAKQDIMKYAEMNGVKIVQLQITNDELGVLCKRQFDVSLVSLSKGEK